jgi:hypothetical protein
LGAIDAPALRSARCFADSNRGAEANFGSVLINGCGTAGAAACVDANALAEKSAAKEQPSERPNVGFSGRRTTEAGSVWFFEVSV